MADVANIPLTSTPRLIIHGGAGNITRRNLTPEAWTAHQDTLLAALRSTQQLLSSGSTAIEAAAHAVSLLEDSPLFNAGHGATFNRAGTNELEASIMVSRGKRKRGCSVMLLRHVKNPVMLAKELLERGGEDDDDEDDDNDGKGGGAYQTLQLSGPEAERLAAEWGLELVPTEYFWTRKRWQEHLKGLERERDGGNPSWDKDEYLPQGTTGAVALDKYGTLCAATSTGGRTNKVVGRIGDTPSFGAGFWAEDWTQMSWSRRAVGMYRQPSSWWNPVNALRTVIYDCIPGLSGTPGAYTHLPLDDDDEGLEEEDEKEGKRHGVTRAVAISGTGDGESFLSHCACHAAAMLTRLSERSLQPCISQYAGPGGQLEVSAGPRWGKIGGEGEAGMAGIELVSKYVHGRPRLEGRIAVDFNCGGMYRAWLDDDGHERCMVFREAF